MSNLLTCQWRRSDRCRHRQVEVFLLCARLQRLPSSRNSRRAVREASRTARASALNGDVRKTGATAVCDPRAAAVCRRASASSRASRSARSAADSCSHEVLVLHLRMHRLGIRGGQDLTEASVTAQTCALPQHRSLQSVAIVVSRR